MERGPTLERHRGKWIGGVLAVVLIVVLAIVGLGVLLGTDDQQSGLDALEATSVDESTLPQIASLEVIGGHIVVDASLNGSDEPTDFILDSGALTTYSDSVANAFGGETSGSISEAAIDGTVLKTEVVPVSTLDIGGAVFQNVGGAKGFLDLDNPLSCISSNGLIGASLMKEAVWQIDYRAQTVTIAMSVDDLDHIEGAVSLPFTSPTSASPSPVVSMGAGNGSLAFLLDTGSDGGLTLNPADLEAIGVTLDESGPTISLLGAGVAGTFETDLVYVGVDLTFGDMLLPAYPVATIDTLAPGQGNIGGAFLDDFITTIDWPSGVVYFDPVAPDGMVMPPQPRGREHLLGWRERDHRISGQERRWG